MSLSYTLRTRNRAAAATLALALLGAIVAIPPAGAADGDLVGVVSFGGTGNDTGLAVAVDGLGNSYAGGVLRGTADFDPGPGTFNLSSAGVADAYVVKLDAAGSFSWARRFGSTGTDQAYWIGVDASGNVYVTGTFEGTVDFDPGPGTAPFTSVGDGDVFLVSLDSNGDYRWARTFGGPDSDHGFGLAVAPNGDTWVTGTYRFHLGLDLGGAQVIIDSNPRAFVARFDNLGTLAWARSLGNGAEAHSFNIAVGPTGTSYLTGQTKGTGDFDPGLGTYNLTSGSPTSANPWVASLSSDGAFQFAVLFTSSSYGGGLGVDVQTSGSAKAATVVRIAGSFSTTTDFDPGPGTYELTSAGGMDGFVATLGTDGSFVSAGRIGGPGDDEARGAVLDEGGSTFLTGNFTGTADLDPGAGTSNFTSAGAKDAFVVKLDPSGDLDWGFGFGSADKDAGREIAVDALGRPHAVGLFRNTVDFEPGPGTTNRTSADGSDAYLLILDGADTDGDGVLDLEDNCPDKRNPSQADRDGDGVGNKCDADMDGDGVLNDADNCPRWRNAQQADFDEDGDGNKCDADDDNDGVDDDNDVFPRDPEEWADSDSDGRGDNGDNCPNVANNSQHDFDEDGDGNRCDPDDDNDGTDDGVDGYPWNPNRQ